MNLPNKLTMLRLFLIPFIIFFLYIDSFYAKAFAFILFLLAVATDFLDGKIARSKNIKTGFGIFMDPVADKILVSSLLVVFTGLGLVPAWMTIMIIAREFIISGIRGIRAAEGNIVAANIWGKTKTFFQMFSISAVLFLIMLESAGKIFYIGTDSFLDLWMHPLIYILMLVTTVATLVSMIGYVKSFKGA